MMALAGATPAPGTTVEHALDGLRRAIVTGELRPSERIPQEEVAEQFGVSIGPLREALAMLEREGQVEYRPRRGYFVAELRLADLREIYALRRLLEAQAARAALESLDDDTLERIEIAARDCADAVAEGDVLAELEANRRFHFAVLDSPGHPHTMRLIALLWDSTEAYRAAYYNSPEQRHDSLHAHDRILEAIAARDAEALIAELDDHREQALAFLAGVLDPR